MLFRLAAAALVSLVAMPLSAAAESLAVTAFVPLPGDPVEGRIVVFFDQPFVLPAEAGGPDPTPLVIDPPLPGDYRLGDAHIVFHPAELPENTILRVGLNPALRTPAGAALADPDQAWYLPTTPFQPLRWAIAADSPEGTVLAIAFPYPINPDSLRSVLTLIAHDGTELVPRAVSATGPIATITLPPVTEWPVDATIAPGLADESGRIASNTPADLRFPVQSELGVEIEWGDYTLAEQEIKLAFTSPVAASVVAQHLILSDLTRNAVVPFRIVTAGTLPTHRAVITLPNPREARVNATLNEGVTSATRARLTEVRTQLLEYTVEPIRVTSAFWEDAGSDGLQLTLELSDSLREVLASADVAAHVTISPPIDEPAFSYRWDGALEIGGRWQSERDYEVRFRAGMPFRADLPLAQDVAHSVKTPRVPGHLAIAHPGLFVFPQREGMALGLDSRNVTEAEVILHRLLPNNLPVALESITDDEADWAFRERWSRRLEERTVTIDGPQDVLHRTALAIDDLFPADRRGVFYLEVRYKTERYSRYSGRSYESYDNTGKLIVFSDIAAMAHWTDTSTTLLAHDIYSLAPREGARVQVYSDRNQLLGEGIADADGRIHLDGFAPYLGRPAVAVVSHEGDDTFLKLDARYDAGNPVEAPADRFDRGGYDALIYGERDLYRPGETVELAWLMRTAYGDAVPGVPFVVTVFRPNGQLLREEVVATNALGVGTLSIASLPTDATGTYTVSIAPPGDNSPAVGSYEYKLEEFVPNRLKATVEPEGGPWSAADERTIAVLAEHLFGAPASGRTAEFSANLARNPRPFEGFEGYSFQDDSDFTSEFTSIGSSETGQDGRATIGWTVPEISPTPLTATLYAEVFEEGGRSVVGREIVSILPGGVTLGLRVLEGAAPGEVAIEAVALHADGTPAAVPEAVIEVASEQWHYNVRRLYDRLTPSWTRSWNTHTRETLALDAGRGTLSLPLPRDGSFRVRLAAPDATAHRPAFFFSRWGTYFSASGRDRTDIITLSLDRDKYSIGETAHLEVEVPFAGKVAVVIHTEESQRMIVGDIVDHRAQVAIPIEDGHFPNAWLEVTAIQQVPEGGQVVHPYAAYAATALRVDRPDRRLAVTLENVPEVLRPAEAFEAAVRVVDHQGQPVQGAVTLALVDEGIHALSRYRTPDPGAHFERLRGASSLRAHYYDHILFNYDRVTPGGGSAEDALALRVAPPMDSWIKPLALWSGVLETDADGRVATAFALPEFEGQVRLVAVAASGTASGAAENTARVRRDFVVRPSLPRFLLPGDTAEVRLTVFNATDEPGEALVQWDAGGALSPDSGGKRVPVPANGEVSWTVALTAGDAPGQGQVTWQAAWLAPDGTERDRLARTDPLPVHTPAAYSQRHALITIPPGQDYTVTNDVFHENDLFSAEFLLAAHPVWQMKGALDALVGYPYGCLEQTVSRAFPLYALRRYEELIGETLREGVSLTDHLGAAVARILSMQTGSGGMAMWPRGDAPDDFASLYALHFLTVARRNHDLHIPDAAFTNLQGFARGIMQRQGDDDPALFLRAYALYTLALDGDLEAIRQIDRFDGISLPRDARYLLAAALAINTQDPVRVRLYLEGRPAHDVERTDDGGTLHSPARDRAVLLLTRIQMGFDPGEVAAVADELMDFVAHERFGSTQERAFAITALAAYLDRLVTQVAQADALLVIDGEEMPLIGTDAVRARVATAMPAVTVVNRGTAPVYLNRVFAGIPIEPATGPIADGLSIQRTLFTMDGDPTGTAFEQTRVYAVKVELHSDQERRQVVVADLLPAGFEVMNPRLPGDAVPRTLPKATLQPAHLDIRDDRIILAFDTVPPGAQTYYYAVRAVTPGRFTHPAALAECMYRPQVRGTTGASTITVTE